MKQILTGSRYLILIAVICILIAATAMLIYGGVATALIINDAFIAHAISVKGTKELLLKCIELVDFFLLSTVLYIIAIGLYELFVDDLNLPEWLVITDLDMLKDKLVGVVIVVLSVLFLGKALTWDGSGNMLGFGGAVALVIAALTYFLSQKPKKSGYDTDKH